MVIHCLLTRAALHFPAENDSVRKRSGCHGWYAVRQEVRFMTTTKRGNRRQEYVLEAVGSNIYPSLEAAQAAALPYVSRALATAIRKGLEKGQLIVVDGEVRIAEREDDG